MEGTNLIDGGINLKNNDSAIQIEDSVQTILRCIVRKATDVYRAMVVHRHGHREEGKKGMEK